MEFDSEFPFLSFGTVRAPVQYRGGVSLDIEGMLYPRGSIGGGALQYFCSIEAIRTFSMRLRQLYRAHRCFNYKLLLDPLWIAFLGGGAATFRVAARSSCSTYVVCDPRIY